MSELDPIRIEIFQNSVLQVQWNRELLVCWQTAGTSRLFHENQAIDMQEDQLYSVPVHSLFHVEHNSGTLLMFYIDILRLDSITSSELPYGFSRMNDETLDNQRLIKEHLAKITRVLTSEIQYKDIQVLTKTLDLLHELCSKFRAHYVSEKSNDNNLKALDEVIRYIEKNYADIISIEDLSRKYSMTPSYFSRIFKQHTGTAPRDFINSIKMSHATYLLRSTKFSLSEIAEKCGVPNNHALIKLYRKRYGITPGEYRKQTGGVNNPHTIKTDIGLRIIEQYWKHEKPSTQERLPEVIQMTTKTVSVNQKKMTNDKNMFKFIYIDFAEILFHSDVQKILKKAVDDIGIEYVYFHGLLDDRIPIFNKNRNTGKTELLFQHLDFIMDILIEIGIKPVIEFSYMPSELAKEHKINIMAGSLIISMPKSLREWRILVEGITRHLVQKYGLKEVESWLFCCWHIPDLKNSVISLGPGDEFFRLYAESYRAVKNVSEKISFGIPNISDQSVHTTEWFSDFMEYCSNHKSKPDYYGFHSYAIDHKTALPERMLRPILSENRDYLKEAIIKAENKMKEKDWHIGKPYIPLWNYCIGSNMLEDTVFKAAYIVRNCLNCIGKSSGMGCGHLIDRAAMARLSNYRFNGLQGMFTDNGIPKASFYAYVFLSRLGKNILDKGEGYCVTEEDGKIQILCYHYQHFSKHYAESTYFESEHTERYFPFDDDKVLHIKIHLRDLKDRKYISVLKTLSRKHGSSYDKWLEMGAVDLNTKEMTEYLISVAQPSLRTEILSAENHELVLKQELEPLEIMLLELTPVHE